MTEHTRTAVMTAPTRDTHTNWAANNPILPEGVLGVVFSRLYSGSVEFFVGDGTHTYAELEKSGDVLSGYVTNTALEAKGFLKENNLTVQTVQNVVEQVQDLGSISSAVALNPAAGNIIKATVAGAVTFTLNAAETGCRVLTLMDPAVNIGVLDSTTLDTGILTGDAAMSEDNTGRRRSDIRGHRDKPRQPRGTRRRRLRS